MFFKLIGEKIWHEFHGLARTECRANFQEACLCVLSMVGIMAAPLFWILAVGHASFTYRKEMVERHADLIATKMAEKMKQP